MQVLIEAGGADVNHPSTGLETALYLAALEGHAAIVKLLLSHGADIDLPATAAAQTPLMVGKERALFRKPQIQARMLVTNSRIGNDIGLLRSCVCDR